MMIEENKEIITTNLNMSSSYEMVFDKNTINHLGIQLYSSFPPILAELLSNSYDAEAKELIINIFNSEKKIEVIDNGHGMTHDELNKEYLVIGRNRRKEDESGGWSKNKKRKVTGKKGLGKLAVFGVANKIEIISIHEGFKNGFIMNYNDLLAIEGNESYKPTPLFINEPTNESNGTRITINQIKENKLINFEKIIFELSKRFNFYDDTFKVSLYNKDISNEPVNINKEIYYNSLNIQFEWKFPEHFAEEIKENIPLSILNKQKIKGVVYTNKTPLKTSNQGFNIYVRGKFASGNVTFNDRANDRFNYYVFGYFDIDCIDDDNEKDYIATARQSILWDANDTLISIKENLNKLINKISNEWRRKRNDIKIQEVDDEIENKIPNLYDDLDQKDKDSLIKIKTALIKNIENEDIDSILEILKIVKSQFQFDTFKKFVANLNDNEITLENMTKIANDWEYIEAKELAKVAVGRIEAIKKFEKFVKNEASETKVIQPFLETFPWLLDPRITSFQREVRFSTILKQKFPDENLDEPNRRIDFLCNSIDKTLMIIELKRPNIKITRKELDQVIDYVTFVLEKYPNKYEKVEAFLVTNNVKMDRKEQYVYDSLKKDGKLVIKTYDEMIQQVYEYHKKFIDTYDRLEEAKKIKTKKR
ncbi:MAG: ATP-binding protein [Spiroplasma sp.]|nr:ATP-binding protein [Spiroplasma sp.]